MTDQNYKQPRTPISAELRRAIEVESGHCCAIKECSEHTYLEIHHIDENRENNAPENLILLCDKHHKMAHKKVIDRKALREYKKLLLTTKRRHSDWTQFIKVDAHAGVPSTATSAKVQFKLWSDNENIPLMIRIASGEGGKFAQEVSGPSGVVELLLTEGQVFYISLSDPEVQYEVGVIGWSY